MKNNSKCRVWVAGLGNVLMSDDGVGAVAARMLSEAAQSSGTVVSEVGTAIVFYTNLISDAENILCLDAVTSGKKPGTVTVFTLDEIEASGGKWRTAHELTLLDAIDVFRHGKRPNIKVIGVEPERIEYGLNLSATVEHAIPEMLTLARKAMSEMASLP
jgi:hydrogenase maturation protease